MKQHNLFPTLIHEYEFTDLELEPLLNFCLNTAVGDHGLLSEGAKSSYITNNYILDEFVAKNIKNKIQVHLAEYAHQLNVHPVKINDSWFNIMSKDQYLEKHRHEGSIISGALYLQAPVNSAGLRFFSPLHGFRMCERHSDTNRNHSPNWVELPCKKGKLILFPSWLEHGTKMNHSQNRLVVSFNTNYESNSI
jgi:uncharacterized protein (TIGR02466 family)